MCGSADQWMKVGLALFTTPANDLLKEFVLQVSTVLGCGDLEVRFPE